MDAQVMATGGGNEEQVRLLLDAIYGRYHHDFRDYAVHSLGRRLDLARMRLGCDTLAELTDLVLRDGAAFTVLLENLTVQVSDLFRDPSYFKAVRDEVVPFLKTFPSPRLWVAGCSAGEEAYSLAIVLREEGLLERSLVYATDINPSALEAAKRGIFDLRRMALFSTNYQEAGGTGSLADHYTARYGGALFDRALRDRILFSDHSLATDSVFAEVQFVSCRNVLIYFRSSLQERAFGLFRDALCVGGVLGLGMRESTRFSPHAQAFEPFIAAERLYRKVRP